MITEPIYAALILCHELYGIELDESTFETYALTAYNKIGNKNYRMRIKKMHPEADKSGGWYVCKPSNLTEIEAITLNWEDAQNTSSITDFPRVYNQVIEQDIESQKRMPNEFYIPGKYVKYQEVGDRIYFTEPFPEVNILYKSEIFDEDDLPFINEKEKNAIAAYCAYQYYFKQGLITRDNSTLQVAAILKKDWLRLCDAARVSQALSQNDAQEIMDGMTTWDRHLYGRTQKPIR